VTLAVDNKSSRRTVDDGVVHDPLHFSVDTISVGGTVTPFVVGSQTAKSTSALDFTDQRVASDMDIWRAVLPTRSLSWKVIRGKCSQVVGATLSEGFLVFFSYDVDDDDDVIKIVVVVVVVVVVII